MTGPKLAWGSLASHPPTAAKRCTQNQKSNRRSTVRGPADQLSLVPSLSTTSLPLTRLPPEDCCFPLVEMTHVSQCGPTPVNLPCLPRGDGLREPGHAPLAGLSQLDPSHSFLEVRGHLGQALRLQQPATPGARLLQMASQHLLPLESLLQTGTLEREMAL